MESYPGGFRLVTVAAPPQPPVKQHKLANEERSALHHAHTSAVDTGGRHAGSV